MTTETAAIPQWQPIERTQIRAGMRIRVTTFFDDDRITTHMGVAHRANEDGDWCTSGGWLLTGWVPFGPITYEVDPATIPADPDAELIEKIGKAIHDADKPADEWGSADAYRKLARVALNAVRESEATA